MRKCDNPQLIEKSLRTCIYFTLTFALLECPFLANCSFNDVVVMATDAE